MGEEMEDLVHADVLDGSWDLRGQIPNTREANHPEQVAIHTGMLEEIMQKSGQGYIRVLGDTAMAGINPSSDRVFIHTKILSRCKLNQGDVFKFSVHVNPAGKLQCSAPVWVKRTPGGASGPPRDAGFRMSGTVRATGFDGPYIGKGGTKR